MPLVTTEKMLKAAHENCYAIAAFNCENMEVIQAVINNLALKDEVCCLGKVFDSGFNTSKNALKGGY